MAVPKAGDEVAAMFKGKMTPGVVRSRHGFIPDGSTTTRDVYYVTHTTESGDKVTQMVFALYEKGAK